MNRDSSASKSHVATCLILLAATTNVPACLAAVTRRAEREGIAHLSEEDVRRAILTVRSQAAAALAALPLAQTPSNGIYAKLGLGGAK